MKRKIWILSALMVLFLPWLSEAAFISVSHKDAKVRLGPGTHYEIRWKPLIFTPLEVLCKYRDWYGVRDQEGDVGWIHQSVVSDEPSVIVVSKDANVRQNPNADAPLAFSVEKGYPFKVLKKQDKWYQVKDADGSEGWISDSLVWGGN